MTINGNYVNAVSPQGIPYFEYLDSWQGAGYILYPIRKEHTEDDVKDCKQYIRQSFDVVRINVIWQKVK